MVYVCALTRSGKLLRRSATGQALRLVHNQCRVEVWVVHPSQPGSLHLIGRVLFVPLHSPTADSLRAWIAPHGSASLDLVSDRGAAGRRTLPGGSVVPIRLHERGIGRLGQWDPEQQGHSEHGQCVDAEPVWAAMLAEHVAAAYSVHCGGRRSCVRRIRPGKRW